MSDISSPGSGGTAKPWRTTASDNNYAPPDGAPEGWQGEEVNNVVREIMTAVRDWYGEPEWQWVLFDSGNAGSDSEVTKTGAQTITISEMTDEAVAEMFPKGARIRLSRTDIVGNTDCFVAETPGLVAANVATITIDGASLDGSETFATNGVALHVARDATAIAFGGYGLESARDAAIPNDQVPDGMVWVTTDIGELGMVQVGKEGAWVSIAPPGSFTDDGATLSIKAGAGSDASLVFEENSVEMASLKYDAGLNETILAGGALDADGGRLYIKDTGGLFWKERTAGDLGTEKNLLSSPGGRGILAQFSDDSGFLSIVDGDDPQYFTWDFGDVLSDKFATGEIVKAETSALLKWNKYGDDDVDYGNGVYVKFWLGTHGDKLQVVLMSDVTIAVTQFGGSGHDYKNEYGRFLSERSYGMVDVASGPITWDQTNHKVITMEVWRDSVSPTDRPMEAHSGVELISDAHTLPDPLWVLYYPHTPFDAMKPSGVYFGTDYESDSVEII